MSQLPATIPAYLINVIPELKLNDTVLMSGPAMPLGQDLTLVFNPTFVSSGVQDYSYNLPPSHWPLGSPGWCWGHWRVLPDLIKRPWLS